MAARQVLRAAAYAALLCLLAACVQLAAPPPGRSVAQRPAPARFLLTFDDGPYGQERDNPTAAILDTLASNGVQPGIKAIFFVQTRSSDGGATALGRALMRREHREGHLLALHDGSAWGHRNHRGLSDARLEQSISQGVADLAQFTDGPTRLLRPPYWAYDERTLAAYRRHGLAALLTDISANDGKDWGFKASPRRRVHLAGEIAKVRDRIDAGELASIDGVIPVVVAFHDTNTYTAGHMAEYLEMLVALAREAGLALDVQPYYAARNEIEAAALLRADDSLQRREMVPWWWRWMLW